MTEPVKPSSAWPEPPEWPEDDPRWVARSQGWLEGYAAGQRDQVEINPEIADSLILDRVSELLALLRDARRA